MTKGFFRAIGLMSGTSADGVSVAITEIKYTFDKPKLRLISYKTYKYPKELQDHILNLRRKSVNELCKMNFHLGKVFVDAEIFQQVVRVHHLFLISTMFSLEVRSQLHYKI